MSATKADMDALLERARGLSRAQDELLADAGKAAADVVQVAQINVEMWPTSKRRAMGIGRPA